MKEHLKHVPDYLVPASMRSVAANRNSSKKKRRRPQEGSTQEKRRQLSKSRDPLYGGGKQSKNSDVGDAAEDRLFPSNVSSSQTISGRQKWKQSHKKGKFNPKAKKNSPLLAGSFTRTKRYK